MWEEETDPVTWLLQNSGGGDEETALKATLKILGTAFRDTGATVDEAADRAIDLVLKGGGVEVFGAENVLIIVCGT